MKYCIVNADDFGLSEKINEGIIFSHLNGIVTSASIIANGMAFEHAINRLHEAPNLDIGVHLNVLRGKPLFKDTQLKYLTNREGRFVGNVCSFLKRYIYFGKKFLKNVENEYRAQIKRVLLSNLKPSYLNSEKHIHLIAGIIDITVDLAKEYKIDAIRVASGNPDLHLIIKGNLIQDVKDIVIRGFSKRAKHLCDRKEIYYTNHFFGVTSEGNLDKETLIYMLSKIKDNTAAEIMVHPGYANKNLNEDIGFGSYFLKESREHEMKILTDKEVIREVEKMEIRLVNYKSLKKIREDVEHG